MRKQDLERIKEEVKKEKKEKKKLEADITFKTAIGGYCISINIVGSTVYKLIKVPNMDQMLETMYEGTIKEYNLHEPTLVRLREDKELKKELERMLEKAYNKRVRIQI